VPLQSENEEWRRKVAGTKSWSAGLKPSAYVDTGGLWLRFSLFGGMCYNHRAVERAWKQEVASVGPKPAGEVSSEASRRAVGAEAMSEVDRLANAGNEDASRYCPVCSQRLESRRCKLVCPVCGYYMSCADYY
jgi:hypothetical protein